MENRLQTTSFVNRNHEKGEYKSELKLEDLGDPDT